MKSLFGAALAVLMSTTPIAAEAQVTQTQTMTGTRLDLQARGEVKMVPDIAIISAGVVTEGQDASTAMTANAARMGRVMAALKKLGIADKDIQTQSVSLNPQYQYIENKPPVITGYQASNQLSIRFRDIAKAGSVLDILVKQGVNQINGPTLTVEDQAASQDKARLAALKTLRTRAELYAKGLGMSVKRIIHVSETGDMSSPMPMPQMMMAKMGDASGTEIAAGEQVIGITVNAIFELQ